MKKIASSLFYIYMLFVLFDVCGQSFVTYEKSGGRFGDNLVACSHALWIAYKDKIKFIYNPFEYSDQLVLHEECQLRDTHNSNLKYRRWDGYLYPEDILYTVPYFTEFPRLEPTMPYLFEVDWQDKAFIDEFKKLISPRFDIKKLDLPEDRISIAVHVRRGGSLEKSPLSADGKIEGFFDNYAKFAPDNYYIEQIKFISELLDHKKLYVHIFTDENNPKDIVDKYEKLIGLDNITFGYRQEENSHNTNVLEDFFNIMHFDCLIMPTSNFSYIASKLGNFSITIGVEEFSWKNNIFVANKLNIKINSDTDLGKQFFQKIKIKD